MAAWEETKNIPNNKEIIIQEGPSASNPFSTEKAHQKPQKKGVKLNKPVKPVNLTNKDSLPEQNSLENTLHSANDLPSNILLNTSNHPQPNTANEESRTQPNLALPDQTAMPPPDVPAHSTPPAPGGSLPDTSTTASSTNNKSTTSRPVDPHVAAESQQPKPPDQPLNTSITSSLSSELPKTAKSSKIPTPQPNNQSAHTSQTNLTIIKSADVVRIYQQVKGVKPNWERYQKAWSSVLDLVWFCSQSIPHPAPHNQNLHFERAVCSNQDHQFFDHWQTSYGTALISSTSLGFPPSLINLLNHLNLSYPIELRSLLPPLRSCQKTIAIPKYPEEMKMSLKFEDTNPDTQTLVVNRSHSADVSHQFHNRIIQVFMDYVIFQTHTLSNAPLTMAQRKKRLQRAQSSSKNPSNTLLGSRLAPVSECMSLMQAMPITSQTSTAQRTPEEPIWKNLSTYIRKLFKPAFDSPNKIVSIHKAPKHHELAEAITMNFLNHWEDKQPSSPFIIPHSSQQISDK
ncbi:hypothetical protein PSTG_10012 [Puccinia striiformis f. sp. tritici PST-78]|uniref:Uncharacterized protein n=2 Tax=Puccinia striiformis TaxID=27350 RepID=A0A0L0VCM3_9BASI|nr:hypothetical protein PSTG_10012 [Puccinia striiformis f. sp. tritici PST-78]